MKEPLKLDSEFSRKVYRYLSSLLRHSPLLDYEAGGRTVRNRLNNFLWRFLRTSIPNPIIVYGHKMYHPFDPVCSLPMATETYEPETTQLVNRLLRTGQVFADVGAHIGYYTLLAARSVGSLGRVYSFEPAPANLSLLVRNIEVNGYIGNVTVIRKVVSDKSGSCTLFLSDSNSGNNSVFPIQGMRAAGVNVEATTLDEFFEREGWPLIHLMKIDVEGGEYAVLKGMEELSRRNRCLRMIIEFSQSSLSTAGVPPEHLLQRLHSLGFSRVSIISPEFGSVDALGEASTVEASHEILRQASGVHSVTANLLCEREASK